jgi:flagellar capping protein FliD
MTVETSLDRQTFLNDFGVDVVTSSKTIKGIFDSPHENLSAGGEVPFSIQESYVMVRTSDVTDVGQGSTLTISDTSYAVTDVQPDGTGMTQLMLEAQ